MNSDSILDQKEETKAFWESKMQPLESEPAVYNNQSASNNNNTNRSQRKSKDEQQMAAAVTAPAALSPPPGFVDSDSAPAEGDDGSRLDQQEPEPYLSAEDYAPVGSITFKAEVDDDVDLTDRTANRQQYIFGEQQQQDQVDDVDDGPTVREEPRTVTRPARDSYFEPAATSTNPTETLIEREIRLQKEREEAVLRERQLALELLEASRNKQHPSPPSAATQMNNNNNKSSAVVREAPMCFKPAQPPTAPAVVAIDPVVPVVVNKTAKGKSGSETVPAMSAAEIRISEEIRELKEREEELRRLRESNARNGIVGEETTMPSFATTDDEGLFSDVERDGSNGSETTSR